MPLELPEMRKPTVPAKFSEIVAATASFGHGLSVSPLHMAARHGRLRQRRQHGDADALQARSLEDASRLYAGDLAGDQRRNPLPDAAQCARRVGHADEQVCRLGYRAGGKTGTAEKVVDGTLLDSTKTLNVFASAFPLDNPRYAMVILVDEPQTENAQSGTPPAGMPAR